MQREKFFVELSPVTLKKKDSPRFPNLPKLFPKCLKKHPNFPKLFLDTIVEENSTDIPTQEELSSPIFDHMNVKIDRNHRLGRGGFGSVFECSIPDSDTVYAAKQIRIRREYKQTHLDVSKESETQYKLAKNSDAFPKVICIAFKKNVVIIVMEKIAFSLQTAIERKWRSQAIVKNCILQLLRGAKEMHKQNIAHMDIKPDNIGITFTDGKTSYKYLDFSADTACDIDENHIGSPKGYTLCYASPEAYSSSMTGEKIRCDLSDTWSIGCTILEMITGIPPWEGLSISEIGTQLEHGNRPDVPSNIRKPFRDFILDCFKNIDERLSPENLLTKYHDVFT